MDDIANIPYQYKSIATPSEGIYKDRGSKFIAFVSPVKSLEEIESCLIEIANLHPKSRHVCFAYRLGIDGEPYRINDDGEPSGSAGRPIFNELLSAQLSDVLCAVVRYFGGTKLGIPGLIKAYKLSAIEALSKSNIVVVTLTKDVQIDYRVEDMGRIYDVLKSNGYNEIQSLFDPHPRILIKVPLNKIPTIRQVILSEYYGYGLRDIGEDFVSDRVEVSIVE